MSNKKITLAFQTWSERHNWWIPNSISLKSYYEKGELPPTHENQWFNFPAGIDHTTLTKDQVCMFPANGEEFLSRNKDVQFTLLDEILPGDPYIFPIFIKSSNYFKLHSKIGFSEVSNRVLNDVYEGIAKIVLVFPWEGTSGEIRCKDDFKILERWCVDAGLNANQVYYIHANLRKPLDDFNFTFIPTNSFITWVAPNKQLVDYVPGSKLFLNYNRNPHYHRCLLVCNLIKENLLSNGIVSYMGERDPNSKILIKDCQDPDLLKSAMLLDQLTPMVLDMKLENENYTQHPASSMIKEHYRNTFLSVVTETLIDPNVLFYSEKTWKPVSIGHPFMLLSSVGSLRGLREQGYQTFSDYWDESYDNMPLVEDRAKAIGLELKKLSQLSNIDLLEMKNKMKPILEHNKQLFEYEHNRMVGSNHSDDLYLYDIIKNIWNSIKVTNEQS